MRRFEPATIWIALVGSALGLALGATPLRSQQPTLTREELGIGQVDFAEAVQGPADVRVTRVTLPPDVAAGWHTHPGPATVVVVRGDLVDYSAAGCRTVFSAGSAILEAANTVHDGRNEGSEPVELLVTYVLPAGQPPLVPAPQPSAAAAAGGGASCQH
jgi:quercetin dioxygenase-like cupin family protein